ncbi:unnamed protein product [Orchesella dallaii]|uniref:Uncharacterized protein n=1 Tax=Orchesella dallaii TaxID=48710 RepID=A0ABP1R270_9HEXA
MHIIWKKRGYIVFLATIIVAFIEFVHLESITNHGYPNSDQGEAAFYYNMRGVFLSIVCCCIILYILVTEHSGYYRAIFIWCMLIAGLCLCLVGVVRSIVWLSFSDPHKVDEMGNHTRNRFEAGLGLSDHEKFAIKEYKCCGLTGILIWRKITDARKMKEDEHDIDEENALGKSASANKTKERKTAHVPDECCFRYAYEGCGEANFIKIIDWLEEPANIMQTVNDSFWNIFSDSTHNYKYNGYVSLNVSDPRILIPNDDVSLSVFPGVTEMCKDDDLRDKPLIVFHVGKIYNDPTAQAHGTQGAPCLKENEHDPKCVNGNIRFAFSSVNDFCLYIHHTALSDADIAKTITRDQLLYSDECGSHMIPYVDSITTFTLIYSSILLILLVCVMVVFHTMYIELRLKQLKFELPPRWYKPFPNEEEEILGFGDVPHIPDTERVKGPGETFKEYAKPPIGKYKGPNFNSKYQWLT